MLDDVIEWVEKYRNPDEVYDREYLKEWAMEQFGLVEADDNNPEHFKP